MLVTKCQLLNRNGKIIGTIGSGIDSTRHRIIKCHDSCDSDDECIYLGKEFNNENLTKAETAVIKYILLGHSAEKIGIGEHTKVGCTA